MLHGAAVGGLGALAWVAFKVGALSYGGGFVIIPLMQHDAVTTYHWMTGAQFLNAVALGQITPGPVVQTVAVVGYAAGGVGGGLLAALVAFAPSFAFILVGGRHFDQIRANSAVESFLTGAGPAVIGAIAGSAIPLGLAFGHLWQIPLLAGALVWLFVAPTGRGQRPCSLPGRLVWSWLCPEFPSDLVHTRTGEVIEDRIVEDRSSKSERPRQAVSTAEGCAHRGEAGRLDPPPHPPPTLLPDDQAGVGKDLGVV